MKNLFFHHGFKENIAIVMASLALTIAEPAIVFAQSSSGQPVNFTEPLSLSRGKISVTGQDPISVTVKRGCEFAVKDWGWEQESCERSIDAFLLGSHDNVDTLLVHRPNSEGYVKMDDWDEDVDGKIKEIWGQLKEGMKAQSKKLGRKIEVGEWKVYPTLDRKNATLHYAYSVKWDGEPTTNVLAIKFDRTGFVKFNIIPVREGISAPEIKKIVQEVSSSYTPANEQSYFDFKSGDKVAAVGALGVLAGVLGVKYGKAVATGLFAMAAIFLKKLWFLIFVIPVVLWGWIKKMFGVRE